MLKTFANDLKKEFKGYNGAKFTKDLMAGLTVAAVALPLALAFGVSSGADAAAGLITAIFAGLIMGVFSGASYQISGPTGAMAAILLPIAAAPEFGTQGVLIAGMISGIVLLISAFIKIGKLVSYIPGAVITGFTTGIAIIIALGQVNNFLGTTSEGSTTLAKIYNLFAGGNFTPNLWAVGTGLLAMLIMIFYPKKLAQYVPGSLAAIIVTLILNLIINKDGSLGLSEVGAIPRTLMTDMGLIKTGIDLNMITKLIPSGISIAILGLIETLLCGATAGKMKNEKMDATRELVAQGLGNLVIPFFGGVPATAAIARTSVAIKSGGVTRLVSVIHSIVLILSMFLLGGVMSRIPLSALAGVLMVTAWRMNEFTEIKWMFKNKFKTSIAQFVITAICTVIFDLTTAILIGVVLSMLLFFIKSCNLRVSIQDVDTKKLEHLNLQGDYQYTKLIYLTGPMFFGTQDTFKTAVQKMFNYQEVIISFRAVPSVDVNALDEFNELYHEFRDNGITVLVCGLQPEVRRMFERYGMIEKIGSENFFEDAVASIKFLEAKNNK